MKKETLLFDMDGTLSPARRPVISEFIEILPKLTSNYNVGIVTGSGLAYIKEQASFLFNGSLEEFGEVHIMPCNGTKYLTSRPSPEGSLYGQRTIEKISEVSMKEELGEEKYRLLIKSLLRMQSKFISDVKIPITGSFITDRDSMINWCPIGRDSDQKLRNLFKKKDESLDLRKAFKILMEIDIKKENIPIDIALGGVTSFDIFPTGWDKTYALNHFTDISNTYFFGDKCSEGGNDFALFEKLNGLDNKVRAWNVVSPEQTIRLLKYNFLNKIL